MSFSFGFSGDDIEAGHEETKPFPPAKSPPNNAFPVPGKPQLPPTHHDLSQLLARLPSKIAYSSLEVDLDDGSGMHIPRRELWDVRMQIMAEDDQDRDDGAEGLGDHDVKTGVYEGGFKSWESSVDLVKVLAAEEVLVSPNDLAPPLRVIELGCGTALPSLALFQWVIKADSHIQRSTSFVVADYNPTVLQLVTLPNFLLAWALQNPESSALRDSFAIDGELELTPEVLDAFRKSLLEKKISLSFVSGAWSPELVELVYGLPTEISGGASPVTLLLGAETIYSPFALQAFTDTVVEILQREHTPQGGGAAAFVAAKRLYFGVGGSLDDFIDKARGRGALITPLREETEGVRRGVVRCVLGGQHDSHTDTSQT